MTRLQDRIREKGEKMGAAPVLIVALGDSVTQGWMEDDVLDSAAVYHRRLLELLEARHPRTTFSVINAGVGGEGAPGGLARLERDVLRHGPDLVLVGYGLNDACGGGREGLPAFRAALTAIVERIRKESGADVVLLTPNWMLTHDNDAISNRWRHAADRLMAVQNGGILADYAQAIREVAAACGCALADIYKGWEELAAAGVDTTARLSNGLNHPTREMHRFAAERVMSRLEPPV